MEASRSPLRRARARGMALALTLLVLAVLAVVLSSAFTTARFGQGVSGRTRARLVASEAARAGLHEALRQMQRDPAWSAGYSARRLEASGATFSVSFQGTETVPASTDNRKGLVPVAGAEGRTVPAGCVHLVAVGEYPGARVRSEALARMGTLPPLVNGLASAGEIALRDSTADSFDSGVARYPLSATLSGFDLRTDGTAKGIVSLEDHSLVYGNAVAGPGAGSKALDTDRSSRLVGTVSAADAPQALSPPAPAQRTGDEEDLRAEGGTLTLAPGAYGAVDLTDGTTATLQAGSYSFSSLRTRDSTLILPDDGGTAWVYVEGDVDMKDSVLDNRSRIPGRFWLLGSPSSETFELDLDQPASLVIYSPSARVVLKDFTFLGAVAASEVSCRNMSLHYDRALRSTPGPPGGMALLAGWED